MVGKKLYFVLKRYFDIIFSLFVFILGWPVFLIIFLCILIDDKSGFPIYKQKRVGQYGKIFMMYKFRSMVSEADTMVDIMSNYNEADGPVFKMKDDPRVTRFGKYLRKSHLDELPQFYNVLQGEMSLVGPRPPLPEEVVHYTEKQKKRLCIKPGVTCYWQTSSHRHDMSFDDWVALDLKYGKKQSVLVDIFLIIKTIFVLFRMEGI